MKLFKSIVLLAAAVFSFQFAQAQTCPLTIVNNTAITYTLYGYVGDAATCNDMFHPLITVPPGTTINVPPPVPGVAALDWLGVHMTAPVNEPYPNSLINPVCYWTGSSINLTWASMCSIVIN